MRVVQRPSFVADLTDAYAYVADRNPAAALRLIDDVLLAAERLSAFPYAGRARAELRPGIRSIVVRRYRLLMFYRVTDDAVVLIRLLHGARHITGAEFKD